MSTDPAVTAAARRSLIGDVAEHKKTSRKAPRFHVPLPVFSIDGQDVPVLRWTARALGDDDLEAYERRAQRGQVLAASAELVAKACGEVSIYSREDGDYVPMREADGQPGAVRFDRRLAALWDEHITGGGDRLQKAPAIVIAVYEAYDARPGRAALKAAATLAHRWGAGMDVDDTTDEEVEEAAGEAAAS